MILVTTATHRACFGLSLTVPSWLWLIKHRTRSRYIMKYVCQMSLQLNKNMWTAVCLSVPLEFNDILHNPNFAEMNIFLCFVIQVRFQSSLPYPLTELLI